MRIIAGKYRGRRLYTPRGLTTRPTADRVKEAIFNILGPPPANEVEPFRVLDLFAGTGALALEALSRGANEAVLVDSDPLALGAAERNVAELGLERCVRLIGADVGVALRSLNSRFDWIFADPPYAGGALDRALRLLGSGAYLKPSGLVIAEHDAKSNPAEHCGHLLLSDRRSWGQTAVSFYRLKAEE